MKISALLPTFIVFTQLISCSGSPTEPSTLEKQATPDKSTETTKTPETTPTPPPNPFDSLKSAQASGAALTRVNEEELSHYFKNAVRLVSSRKQKAFACTTCSNDDWESENNVSSSSSNSSSSSSSSSGEPDNNAESVFSNTTVHVNGVDEADISKYDGKYWYLLNQNDDYYSNDHSASVLIYKTNPQQWNAELLTSYPIDNSYASTRDLYLQGEGDTTTNVIDISHRRSPSRTSINVVNTEDPLNPKPTWHLEVEGDLVDSRKIGDIIYLVSDYSILAKVRQQIKYQDWNADEQSINAVQQQNEQWLKDEDLSSFMPSYSLTTHESTPDTIIQPLSKSCYLGELGPLGYSNVTHITAINVKSKTISSECIGGKVEVISLSQNRAVLTGSYIDENSPAILNTYVHKFELSEAGPEYLASGSVTGVLTNSSDQAFKIHANNTDIRLVTSINREHQLHILEEKGSALKHVSTLPNTDRPAAIGLPGEDIYSVRFDGDIAYIVTFGRAQTSLLWYDPIYRIDLSNRLDPKITGDLELPGYATYMQPVGKNHLLTLGNDVNEITGCIEGVKVELFDISSDIPSIVNTYILGDRGASSIALDDLGAITYLNVNENQLRIAIPTDYTSNEECRQTSSNSTNFSGSSSSSSSSGGSNVNWSRGLHMFEVNTVNETKALVDLGMLNVENNSITRRRARGESRSIIHGDTVYFTRSNAVWSAQWGQPETLKGPFTGLECIQGEVPGLSITLSMLEETSPVDLCSATVTVTDLFDPNTIEQHLTSTSDEVNPKKSCTFTGVYDAPKTVSVSSFLEGHIINNWKTEVTTTGNHCNLETQTATFYTRTIANCQTNNANPLTFIPRAIDEDFNSCNAKMTAITDDGTEYIIPAIPAPQLKKPSNSLLSRIERANAQCVFQTPVLSEAFTIRLEHSGYASFTTHKKWSGWDTCSNEEQIQEYYLHKIQP